MRAAASLGCDGMGRSCRGLGRRCQEEGSTLRGLVKRYMRDLALEKGCGKLGDGARGYKKGHLLTYPGVDPS